MTQRPDLFGAALPAVGVMDMLRFHKFTDRLGVGRDYGSSDRTRRVQGAPARTRRSTTSSRARSIRPRWSRRPTTTTAWCRRTASSSPRRCRRRRPAPAPVLIRIETRAGHGAGKPTDKLIEERADMYGFLLRELKMTLPAGYGK